MALHRRDFLRAGAAIAASSALPGCATRARPGPSGVFAHGVASGDPLAERVILWTRVNPAAADGPVEVAYRVARDAAFREVAATGSLTTGPAQDYTVKVDVGGLAPATSYHYRFEALGAESPSGRTRTLPRGDVERVRFGVCSCASYPQGYFHAYARLAARDDLDAVLHLGDYLYEYGRKGYGRKTGLGREVEPPHEIVSLDDYRTRYAQYRSDPDLQALHARHPTIAIWDDHEFTNNAWRGGAANHQPESEGPWKARRAAAIRAYEEWLPIRPIRSDLHPGRIYRAFRFGDLADLVMLDTRLVGRDEQTGADDLAAMADPGRSLLGAPQSAWMQAQLDESVADGTRWRVLGQQVLIGQVGLPGEPRNSDVWDGYEATRSRLLAQLEASGDRNLVVLTGDYHSSWALEVGRDPFSSPRPEPLAVEFVTPAVSATPLGAIPAARKALAGTLGTHPHVRYFEMEANGYLVVDVDAARCRAEWWYPGSVRRRSGGERMGAAFETASGSARLVRADGPPATGAPR